MIQHKKRLIPCFSLMFCLITGAENITASASAVNSLTEGSAGSVSFPEGKTVVVTILADDNDYSWTDSRSDKSREHNICSFLGIACDYLTGQAADYSKDLTFVSDFENEPDLLYRMTANGSSGSEMDKADHASNTSSEEGSKASSAMADNIEEAAAEYADVKDDENVASEDGDNYADEGNISDDYDDEESISDDAIWAFIDANVPSGQLLSEYDAVNILYLVCVNSDRRCQEVTATRSWYGGMPYPYEFVDLYYVDSGFVNPPAVYAHEMLHTFGAPDLYMAYEDDGITENDVTWVEENRPNDIMLTCSDLASGNYLYNRITNDVTDVTAWYVGWANDKPAGMP